MATEDAANLNSALFGSDAREGVVGCDASDVVARVYRRAGDELLTETVEWRPWLASSARQSFPNAREVRLEGEGYCWHSTFDSVAAFHEAREALRQRREDVVAPGSLDRQFLMQTGITFFKGMAFDDARRMQVDIETNTLSSANPDALILMVAVSDNRGFREAVSGSEAEILSRLNGIIIERDPDVIEGHNIFGFDLPYLAARSQACGVPMNWGRDGSAPRAGSRRNLPFGGITRPFTPIYIQGRSVIDTLFGVQRYDVGRGEFTSHGLKEVAAQLGLSGPDRVYVDRRRMDRLWKEDPGLVRAYALDDVRETGELARIVMPADFFVSQMAPDSYQANACSGTGEKINLLLMREYLRRGHAIPKASPPRAVAGGYTEVRRTGLIERVVKCDVESLYPSLMLSRGIAPASDSLGVFLPLLKELTARRLEAKARKNESSGTERATWDGLQASSKILINSFYGYLGASFYFNDPDAAERVTAGGQEIVLRIVSELERTGSAVVEVDTDGVYFQPPESVQTPEEEERYVESISAAMPEGIHIAHDGRWKVMLSLRVKNYILVGYEGQRIYRGAALRSRADEPFGHAFIGKAVDLIIEGRTGEIRDLYLGLMKDIDQGRLKVEEFSRRTRVTAKSLEGRSLQRAAAALSSVEQGDYVKLYRRGDGTLALMEDYAGDEDREHLKDKLYKFALRLSPLIGESFEQLCPNPRGRVRKELAGQQSLDLFG